jgi:RNA polymerase sigma-70 factor, ECF subfamily
VVDHHSGRNQDAEVATEEQFMQLFLQSERRLLGFILSLVPHLADAEDLLQETFSVMWRKFEAFQPGTDFVAWGISIARYRVLDYRRKSQQDRLLFSESLMMKISEFAAELGPQSNLRVEALQECLAGLREKDRELIRLRYFADNSTKGVAEQVGRGVDSIYKSLNRIHDRLLFCIRHSLRTEG